MSSYIGLVRSGFLTAPPAMPGGAPRVIQLAEIYHLVHYPDHDALKTCLSCEHFPDPYDMLLLQVQYSELSKHTDWFPKAGLAPPMVIMNLAASLTLQITQIRRDNPDISIEFGVMYLSKILHTSPYVPIHQFLLDAYMAASQINEHVWTRYNKWGSTDTIKNMVIKVYDGLLKLEVDVKDAWDRKHQFVTRPENVARSCQRNTNHATLGQGIGLDQETFESLAQAAFLQCIDPRLLEDQADPATTDGQAAHAIQGGQTVEGGQANPATTDGEVAHALQGGQTVEAPPPDPYNLLGITSLETGGRLSDWEVDFEEKLRSLFDDFELGIIDSGKVFTLDESFYDEDAEYEDVTTRRLFV